MNSIIFAITLGFLGSFSHCVGMCGGITFLMHRQGLLGSYRSKFIVHSGRITAYSFLGLLMGSLGGLLDRTFFSHIAKVQGLFAVFAATTAFYMALAFLGILPSPELLLIGITRWWGRKVRLLTNHGRKDRSKGFTLHLMVGFLWGLLPCGLVLAGLLSALVSNSPLEGFFAMAIFGLGTLPAVFGLNWLSEFGSSYLKGWSRRAAPVFRISASMVVLIFGTQMALRGLAFWGWVGHYRLGTVMLW